MTQRERMDKGLIYDPGDSDIMTEQTGCLDLLYDFNDTRPSEGEKRQALLKKCSAASEKAATSSHLSAQIGQAKMYIWEITATPILT